MNSRQQLENEIETAVEHKFNRLDKRLMSGEIHQQEYDDLAKDIADWADSKMFQVRFS